MPDHQPQSQIQHSAAAVNLPHASSAAAVGLPQASSAATVSLSQLAAALSPCTYIALQCSHCGDLRLALAQLPSSAVIRCPQCGVPCRFVLLGRGFTRRTLPFFEIPSLPTKLLARRDEIPACDPPSLNLSG